MAVIAISSYSVAQSDVGIIAKSSDGKYTPIDASKNDVADIPAMLTEESIKNSNSTTPSANRENASGKCYCCEGSEWCWENDNAPGGCGSNHNGNCSYAGTADYSDADFVCGPRCSAKAPITDDLKND